MAKKKQQGGLLKGKSHKQGGIAAVIAGQEPVELEGGEYIVRKSIVDKVGKKNMDKFNKEGRIPTMKKGGKVTKKDVAKNKAEMMKVDPNIRNKWYFKGVGRGNEKAVQKYHDKILKASKKGKKIQPPSAQEKYDPKDPNAMKESASDFIKRQENKTKKAEGGKVAKGLKISEKELKRLKKASPYEKAGQAGRGQHKTIHEKNLARTTRGSNAYQKYWNKLQDSDVKADFEKEYGFGGQYQKDGTIRYPREGSRKNPLKKKPKKAQGGEIKKYEKMAKNLPKKAKTSKEKLLEKLRTSGKKIGPKPKDAKTLREAMLEKAGLPPDEKKKKQMGGQVAGGYKPTAGIPARPPFRQGMRMMGHGGQVSVSNNKAGVGDIATTHSHSGYKAGE